MPVTEGRKAPAFTLKDQNGDAHKLADYAGKNVILYFYPRDDTPGCTKEACGFRDLKRQLTRRDTVVLGCSPDGEEKHKAFIKKFKLNFPLLCDPDKKVMTKYGAFGEKMMYGKKVQGVIRSTVWIGPDGKVRKHWPKVAKAADHPAKVLEAMDEADA
ncbi:MAG: peroxiredoxin [bacterium]|nr:peroxiredoxin [bacterium]